MTQKIFFLKISHMPNTVGSDNRRFLKASFHDIVSDKNLTTPQKEISAPQDEFVPKLIKELGKKDGVAKFYFCDPEISTDEQALFHRVVVNYFQATLPKGHTVLKVSKSPDKNNEVDIVIFESEETAENNLEPQDFISGKPIIAATKLFDHLHNILRSPVKLVFVEGMSEKIKEMFEEVISLYNKALKHRTW